MKDIKLKLYEIIALDVELNGMKNPTDNTQLVAGLLSYKIPLVAKYWITELSNTTASEKRSIEKLRDDLVKQYGKAGENGSYTLEMYTDSSNKELNPSYIEFNQKYSELLNEEKEIKYNPIKLSLLEKIDSPDNFPYFFKFIDPTA